ncbi:aromatic-ring hydroxylase C-terminal domain-containing protein [Actinomadura montaniterrae]|uniref:aromatic-ring hydroxylase C-terminal domain-containing protein n=1 Tax=Actinomadura montaniterrae TaxID=1803903 RepID=UPI001CEF8CCD|nr:hypothetical protein [Actinomadura montaniterrae]
MLKNITGIGRGYDLPGDHALTGMPAPDVPLADGGTLDERCRDGRTVLVTAGAAPAGFDERLAVAAPGCPGPSLLVRPDGYVAWAADMQCDH